MADTAVVVPFKGDFCSAIPTLDALKVQSIREEILIVLSIDGMDVAPSSITALTDIVLNGTQAGPATARNRGWLSVPDEVKYILFTDSDCIPDPDWAERMRDKVKSDFQAVKGVYSEGGKRLVQRLSQIEFEERYRLMSRAKELFLADTYSAGFLKNWLEKLNGFDENFPLPEHEDVDLSWRFVEKGGRIAFEPSARVKHKHRASWKAYFKTKFRRGKWRAILIKSFPSRAVSDGYTPQTLKLQMFCSLPLLLALLSITVLPLFTLTLVILFNLLCIPLLKVCFDEDRSLLPIIPFFAFWRGLALLSGFMVGIISKKVK